MSKARRVIVTTEYRGVFHGTLEAYDEEKRSVTLTAARCVIRWGTEHGWLQLAATGPPSGAKLGSVVSRLVLPGITSIADCSPEAREAWALRS